MGTRRLTKRLNAMEVGKTLAFTNISFWNEKDELVARGSHTKFVNTLTYPHNCTEMSLFILCIFRYVKLAWNDKNNIADQLMPASKESSG